MALSGELVVCPTAEEATERLSRDLAAHLHQRLAVHAPVHLALSGGSSAVLLGTTLADDKLIPAATWANLHVWMVDERCVPPHDPRLNFALLRDTLFSRVPLAPTHVHPMPVLEANGPARYEAELHKALAMRTNPSDRRLDAVVLGMGPDGHTASLFPDSPALDEREHLIVLNDGDKVVTPRPRMTMTYPLLNGARFIALLVTGASKQQALAAVAAHPGEFHALPVAGIAPTADARLCWYLDRAAWPHDTSATSVSG
jgi:6-phosphogluconolactonase